MEVITIASRKGGTAKSTTVQNLAAGLTLKGRKVLVIDLDSQANLTTAYNADPRKKTAADLLTGTPAEEAIQHTEEGDIIPAEIGLSLIEEDLKKKPATLAAAIEGIKGDYDYIFIDTPADLNPYLVNALSASTGAIITAQADIFSAQGIAQLNGIIKTVQKRNKDLKIKGILLVRYKKRSKTAQAIAEQMEVIAERLGTKVYKTRVRECGAVGDAQSRQQSVFSYNIRSNAAKDYAAVIAEL